MKYKKVYAITLLLFACLFAEVTLAKKIKNIKNNSVIRQNR